MRRRQLGGGEGYLRLAWARRKPLRAASCPESHRLSYGEKAKMPSQPNRRIAAAVQLAAWFAFFWYTGPLVLNGLIQVFSINWANTGWGDCRVDWAAARLFLQKRSPYSEEALASMGLQNYGFGHPPTTSFWFIPFATVGYPVMSEILAVLTLVALLFHFIICAHELNLPAKAAFVLLPFGLVLQTTWFRDHLVIVQVSEIIAFLFTLSWYFLRRGRDVEAGIALGAACTFKLFPGVLVLFLLLTRRFRGVAAACVTYLAIAIYMTTGYGLRAWPEFFHQQGPIASYWAGHIRNASLHGIIVRLFRPLCERPVDDAQALEIVGALRKLPSVPSIPGSSWAMAASVLLLAFCWWLSKREATRTATVDVPYTLFSAVAVFVNPWIWEHYAVLLITPLFVLVAAAQRRAKELGGLIVDVNRPPHLLSQTGVELLVLAAAALALATLLSLNMSTKIEIYGQYWALRNANEALPRGLHARMHWWEALNWLPWVVAVAGLTGLAFFERRRYALPASTGADVLAPAALSAPDQTSELTRDQPRSPDRPVA